MTSLSPIRTEPPSIEGRSVRDIVETSPELVNEVWCRKIFRQILQSLELQYAMQMPHRAITPDTIVFHENGEPLLVPALIGEPALTESEDLHALAAIVHYAITREPVATGPLRGRAPEGYSESLLTAVDRCLAPDPAQRPRGIDELRDILGIVSLGPPVGAQLPRMAQFAQVPTGPRAAAAPGARPGVPAGAPDGLPSFVHETAPRALGAGLSRWQRWALAAGGAAVLAALALTMFAELRDSGSYDHIVLTLPQSGDPARRNDDGALLAGPAGRVPAPGAAGAVGAVGADSGGATGYPGQGGLADGAQPQGAADAGAAAQTAQASQAVQEAGAAPADDAALAPSSSGRRAPATQAAVRMAARMAGNAVPPDGASFRLRIQPWGVVYVDGVDRGVSPPVKRLALAPGRHTLRVTNPAFPDRVLEVDTGSGNGQIAVDFYDDAK